MQNALLALRNHAPRSGFELSFEPFGSLVTSNSDACLVRVKMLTDSVSPAAWLSQAMRDVKFCQITPSLKAADLVSMRSMLYQALQLTPARFRDIVRAANLLAQMRRNKPQKMQYLIFLSKCSCYAVFKAFVQRVFKMSPRQVFNTPEKAQLALARFNPAAVSMMVAHFEELAKKSTAQNDMALFFVVASANSQNQLTKPTHKVLDKKRREK
jgi:hypothetical protein